MTSRERALATYAIYARARDARKMTDYTVAMQAGFGNSTICDWKHGKYTPKVEKLIAIAQVLNVPIEMLIAV